jgi:lipoprotein-anchoring transpeptidase ErfK/SrfK
MKKNIVFFLLMAALVFAPSTGFSAEATDENESDALEISQTSSGEELQKSEPDAFKKDEPSLNETPPAPIARVSSDAKEETVKVKAVASRNHRKNSSGKKTAETQGEPETSSSLSSAEMQRRWKELFSKEITPDSIAYVVKPGDSLYVIAQKNHTTVDLIKKINDLKEDSIYPRMKLKVHTSPFSIQIDKSKNVLVLYSNGEAVKKYSVATGKKNSTPVGEFKITDKLVNPTWFKTGAILPPESPENALGTRWMGFDKPAYGIHGTIEPKSIGTQASEGCVRMLNKEVEELYSLVPVGTKVTIQD